MAAWIIPALAANGVNDPARSAGFALYTREPKKLTVRVRGAASGVEVHTRGSERLVFGPYALCTAHARLEQLSPDSSYEVEVCDGETPVDRCVVRTWPEALGTDKQPFQLFLGSCYSFHTVSDGGNDLSALVRLLRGKPRLPHLKVLCGDQVYLDIPVRDVLVPRKRSELRKLFAERYLEAWVPHREDERRTFGELLRTGSTLFVTDDHEFWNNYPYFLSYGPGVWSAERAGSYAEAAHELVSAFQLLPPSLRTYNVGAPGRGFSLALLDGRTQRNGERHTAHRPEDLDALTRFLAASTEPAVVVLSQPLFDPAVSWLSRTFADRGLADLDDYERLVEALSGCPHDVLVLSGDIHGGRICSTLRRARGGRKAQQIMEVISSPLSLVEGSSYCDKAPSHLFPEKGKADRVGSYSPIRCHFGPVRANHGCMLRLWASEKRLSFACDFVTTKRGSIIAPDDGPYKLA